AYPSNDVESKGWFPVTPETIENFSATAYFFGRDLQAGLEGIPIGLIHTSWGGTKIEAWTSAAALEAENLFVDEIAAVKTSSKDQDKAILAVYKSDHKSWLARVDSIANDLNSKNFEALTSSLTDETWSSMDIPTYWELIDGFKKYDGLMWFKRQVNLPDAWAGEELIISLGTVDDHDWTYLNGKLVGQNMASSKPSEYQIRPEQFHVGEQTLAVRVLDVNRRGGLWGRTQDLFITARDSKDTLWLAGSWAFKPILNTIENNLVPLKRPYLHNRPSVLYNAMIAALTPLSIRGVIWYQGESNGSRAHEYRTSFPLLIRDWRNAWGQGNFPFLYVQLPNWGKRKSKPAEDKWAELRDAQLQTLSLPNTAMAVTIDIGDERDIHPKNKQEVGRRLALLALNQVYGQQDVAATGPLFKTFKKKWGKIRVRFDKATTTLATSDGREPVGFTIAGEDRVFHRAEAKIIRQEVVVWSKEVKRPVAVRYAWAANPDCNLTHLSGLPASPFKTDDWPDTTE
ncbi:MAG: 9-O-acetylesterase, partial [Candidatus Marinimicrobia bacterium]|nr:9-O-acetylesterase [Candidatus Neomarinimicrobiota bacterium]